MRVPNNDWFTLVGAAMAELVLLGNVFSIIFELVLVQGFSTIIEIVKSHW